MFNVFCSIKDFNPLKILFLTYQGDVAGSTNSIAYLAKGLAEKGHLIYIGIRKESLLWDLLEGSKVQRIPMTFKGKFDFENWCQIKDAVQEHGIQLINPQSSHDRYTSIFSKWRYGLNVKIIHTRRQMPKSFGGPLQLLLYNKYTDGIVAVGEQVKEGLVKVGMKAKNIEVIYNGTPTEKYNQVDPLRVTALKEKYQLKETDFVLGCVSRIKNQIQIIKALDLLKEPITVIFCGIEPTEEMRSIMNHYKVTHKIHFEAHVDSPEILNYYKLFDANILASTMEGLSQALLESMALEVPVTATAYAGNLDLIQDGENGLLFTDGDIPKIAENIRELKQNDALRERLKTNGQQTALVTFNIENTISNYEEYFLGFAQ
ncbi:glycosyltransferase family 4 protein [Roseivirga sp.]|uniref:glycosyltransferase family 4 protein n=1 Tax=Roseivirga sp. TaxID=1964215 RepID=UPI003B8B30C6